MLSGEVISGRKAAPPFLLHTAKRTADQTAMLWKGVNRVSC